MSAKGPDERAADARSFNAQYALQGGTVAEPPPPGTVIRTVADVVVAKTIEGTELTISDLVKIANSGLRPVRISNGREPYGVPQHDWDGRGVE